LRAEHVLAVSWITGKQKREGQRGKKESSFHY
jgi:hypothetical protein